MTERGINRRLQIEITPDLIARFEAGTQIGSDSDCWPWKKATRSGYGTLKHRGKLISTHVAALVIATGEQVPDGMIVRHKCDNRLCNNPAHLEIGTPIDNVRDMHERHPERITRIRGSLSHKAVLSEPLVRAIRLLNQHGYGQVRLAKLLGLDGHEYTIGSVLKGESWRHLL